MLDRAGSSFGGVVRTESSKHQRLYENICHGSDGRASGSYASVCSLTMTAELS